jgi:hypothetical protein
MRRHLLFLGTAALAVASCTPKARDFDGTGGQGGAGATSSSTIASATSTSSSVGSGGGCTAVTPCQGNIYQCGDCIDNDGDGLIDADDPECTGACDNAEQGFFIDMMVATGTTSAI